MLSGVLILLVTVTVLLAIPVNASFELSWRQALGGRIKLSWLFGLIRLRFSPSVKRLASGSGEKSERRFGQFRHAPMKKTNLIAGIQHQPFRRRIMRYLHDCWRAIRKNNLRLQGRVGLGDPADTGHLWAIMGPLTVMLQNVQSVTIHIEPEFVDAILELDSRGEIRFVPLQLIYLTIGLLLSPPVWRGLSLMRRAV